MAQPAEAHLPLPEWTCRVELAADPTSPLNLLELPAAPGLYCLEDEHGGCVLLATSADVRRLVRSRLEPVGTDASLSRRIDYRSITRTVRALPVGSAFEADWAYLQHARRRMPESYRAALDRWQAWFITCDPLAPFPQWSKTSQACLASGTSSRTFGPLPDKHAAARYIELLTDAFDLCRYHHLLIQAPNASACAYKEMGRCPAPCDGTVSMEHYRGQIADSISFAATPLADWTAGVEEAMRAASASLDFEEARRLRELIERTRPATRAEFARVAPLEQFQYLAVMPSPATGQARLFLILGGCIEPLGDVPVQHSAKDVTDMVDLINRAQTRQEADFTASGSENIGLVCWHLFRPQRSNSRGEFLSLSRGVNVNTDMLSRALCSVGRNLSRNEKSGPADVADQCLETLP